ncbi:MAG: BolA family transcriptional regulator [Deltaproteobacteria bacterium]|nr:BolA family transcriptional regulator [Deltaproteobacteria bacterium]
MVEAEDLEQRIRQGVGDVSHIVVNDLTGTKDHWEALIVSEAVYAALGELMAGPVHALALKTYSPESWAKQEG